MRSRGWSKGRPREHRDAQFTFGKVQQLAAKDYDRNVFVNCPFDSRYKPLFHSCIFTIVACGYNPRCALELELSPSDQSRIDKLFRIITECRLGVHDLSRIGLDSKCRMPRFNMPLELGMFLGAWKCGDKTQKKKTWIGLVRKKHTHQVFISDLAGVDFHAHEGKVNNLIGIVRNWLRNISPDSRLPGPAWIQRRYTEFRKDLPELCHELNLTPSELTFVDYVELIRQWIAEMQKEGRIPQP